MATIPSPVPTVAPTSQGLPGVNVRAIDDAFGVGVARADQQFGKQLEASADELFKVATNIQQTRNDAEAKEADAQYTIRAGELFAEYQAKQGKDAVDARPAFVENLSKLHDEVRGSLSNPAAQRIYDSTTRQSFARTVFSTASHAATESRRAALGASEARVQAAYETGFRFPEDPNQVKSNLQVIQDEVRAQAKQKGLTQEQTIQSVGDATSKFVANQAIAMSRSDPFKAADVLKNNNILLNQADRDRAEKVVIDGKRNVRARLISDEVMFGIDPDDPKKSVGEAQEEALEKAAPYLEEDPLLKDAVKDRIAADWGKVRAVKRDGDWVAKQTMEGLLMGQGWVKPTTVEQLTASPEGRAAWDRLDNKTKRAYQGQLVINARNEIKSTDTDEWSRLRGMAQSNPAEFLDESIATNGKLNDTSKKQLINTQMKLKEKAESDPRVQAAVRILQPDLRSAGITLDRKDEYYQFVGALQDAIEMYQGENKKAPKAEEIRKIGAQLMQAKGTETLWSRERMEGRAGSFWGTAQPLFKTSVPDKDVANIKGAWIRRFGAEPRDDQIQRAYVAKKYQELFGKKVSTPDKDQSKPGQPKPPVSQ